MLEFSRRGKFRTEVTFLPPPLLQVSRQVSSGSVIVKSHVLIIYRAYREQFTRKIRNNGSK